MDQSVADIRQRSAVRLIAGFVLIGFVVRCLAAQGGLWTDEAWSLIYAQKAGDALGVLTRINHDNNHHLNSWWIQLVGPEAPPPLMRGLSIVTSSITIWVAARIGLRRNRLTGVITAALFALSPIMVIYGSEARGYAPMMLALMIMIWRIEIWLDNQVALKPTLLLALCALLGTLAHLTMLPAVVMLGLWLFLAGVQRYGVIQSARVTADVLGPALAIAILCVSAVIITATRSETGLQVGGYISFEWSLFSGALAELLTLTTGFGYTAQALIYAIITIVAISLARLSTMWQMPVERKWFYAVLILTMPVAVAVFNPGNSQYVRYYLPCAIAILLIIAEWVGHFAIGQTRARIGMMAILTGMLSLALVQNYQLIASQRGHPEQALQALMRAAPKGTEVTISIERIRATLTVAALSQHYPLRISQGKCGTAKFHFVSRSATEAPMQMLQSCEPSMRLIAFSNAFGPSGESWSLYQRQALPRPITAVSSAPSRQ